ncbi:hypothetical protein SAY86_017753 [Trapa natans]|uniref:Uncharacterized protein n=1 Tax=Trapa natans TaxID=22666 RepID=A0AAN7LRT6_TRANT|nr:hypothetical protein SAY86_017753 [Trapa natans]
MMREILGTPPFSVLGLKGAPPCFPSAITFYGVSLFLKQHTSNVLIIMNMVCCIQFFVICIGLIIPMVGQYSFLVDSHSLPSIAFDGMHYWGEKAPSLLIPKWVIFVKM